MGGGRRAWPWGARKPAVAAEKNVRPYTHELTSVVVKFLVHRTQTRTLTTKTQLGHSPLARMFQPRTRHHSLGTHHLGDFSQGGSTYPDRLTKGRGQRVRGGILSKRLWWAREEGNIWKCHSPLEPPPFQPLCKLEKLAHSTRPYYEHPETPSGHKNTDEHVGSE